MPKCAHCGRPIAARWKKCLFCRRANSFLDARGPYLDRRLTGLRWYGLGTVPWVACGGLILFYDRPVLGGALVAFAVLSTLVHLALPLHAAAWRAAEVLWALTTIATIAALAPLGLPLLAALLPAVTLAVMLRWRRHCLARLEGREPEGFVKPDSEVPKGDHCEVCGSRHCTVVAPLYVASFFVVSTRMPGTFRTLCDGHAKRAAWPALVVCVTVGWLGFPGILWAIDAIMLNVSDGGVTLGSDLLRELRRKEAAEGGLDTSPIFDFVLGSVAGCIAVAVVTANIARLVH
jgi:hypothetical protein